jgi:DNA-binding NarL/FixJ family response regulator
MAPKHRLLIVDDHPLFREGLRQWIEQQRDLECCGECEDVASALQAIDAQLPDLVILDLRLRDSDGLDLIKEAGARFPTQKILVVSQGDERVYAERVLRAGAKGYIMKEEATEQVSEAIRTVLAGELYLSRALSGILLKRYLGSTSQDSLLARLSDRELQVFQLLGSGLGSREIAAQLNLSVKTVETYRENLKHKLNFPDARTLVQAAVDWVREDRLPRGRST